MEVDAARSFSWFVAVMCSDHHEAWEGGEREKRMHVLVLFLR